MSSRLEEILPMGMSAEEARRLMRPVEEITGILSRYSLAEIEVILEVVNQAVAEAPHVVTTRQ